MNFVLVIIARESFYLPLHAETMSRNGFLSPCNWALPGRHAKIFSLLLLSELMLRYQILFLALGWRRRARDVVRMQHYPLALAHDRTIL